MVSSAKKHSTRENASPSSSASMKTMDLTRSTKSSAMAQNYSEYLSANVLNDGQVVSYRTLSRALKIHSNLAKQMLYDFHRSQNQNKPKSLHATYLITGKQTIQRQLPTDGVTSQDGPDTVMQSSPAPSSPPHEQQQEESREYSATSILLVDEDHLENAKSTFSELLSVHVYSLQPGKLNDLQVLSECNRTINTTSANEDLLETSKQYGVIQNSQVQRRPLRRQPQQQQPVSKSTAPATSKPTKAVFASTKGTTKDTPKDTSTTSSTPDSSQSSVQTSKKRAAEKPVPLKRDSSSLFKVFAKAKPKTQSQNTDTSAEPSPAVESALKEDEPMHDLSDEEADDEDAAAFDEGALTESGGKSKKEREEELRRMMDMEDEPMADAPSKPAAVNASEEAHEEAEVEPEPQPKEEPEETVTVTNGRRRGRRRVMKKKTVQDEEGYLVTREEPGWESFSEEEPVAKKPKVTAAQSAPKPKKAAPKGQGNIMSFFSKK